MWIGSSYKDLRALPLSVRRRFGYALSLAQWGDRDDAAKALKGFGGTGVLEVIEDGVGGTYRAVTQLNLIRLSSCCIVFKRRARVTK